MDNWSWKIEGLKDLDAVADAIEEREAAIAECEKLMEEEYDYQTMKEELTNLKECLRSFMEKNDHAQLTREGYRIVLVKRSRNSWNESKLKNLLPKGVWLKVTRLVVDRDKIDDLVREGTIDMDKIAPALESKADKPHLRWYFESEGDGEAEAKSLAEAMNG
jgi:hypothetical protein